MTKNAKIFIKYLKNKGLFYYFVADFYLDESVANRVNQARPIKLYDFLEYINDRYFIYQDSPREYILEVIDKSFIWNRTNNSREYEKLYKDTSMLSNDFFKQISTLELNNNIKVL